MQENQTIKEHSSGYIGFFNANSDKIWPDVLVSGHQMPLWPSAVAVVVLGGLSIWMWRLSRAPR